MMRLNKFIAQAGISSRRRADELILDGKIKVNGVVTKELGKVIDANNDQVEYGQKLLKFNTDYLYLALNKPVGYIASASGLQGKSVLELVKTTKRVYPVGRLDKDSCGLIILTNDGDLTNHLTHPKYEKEKEYQVLLNKDFEIADQRKMEQSMVIGDKKLRPVNVVKVDGRKINLILHEGINRQIRKMLGRLGYGVMELKRIRIGRLKLGALKPGEYREIKKEEII